MRTLGNVAKATGLKLIDSGSECLFYALDQLGSLSGLSRTIKRSPAAKKLFANAGVMVITDLLPIMCAHAFYNLLWGAVFPDQSIDDDSTNTVGYTLMAPMLLLGVTVGLNLITNKLQTSKHEQPLDCKTQMPLLALATATGTAHHYFQTRLLIRSSILTLQHHDAFHMPNHPKPLLRTPGDETDKRHEVCKLAKCKPMRYAKGEVRAYITYILLSLVVAVIPLLMQSNFLLASIGNVVAFFLGAQLYGEMFLEYFLADNQMCDRHRMVYFQEHPELSLSLGMMHAFTCMLLSYSLSHTFNIPYGQLDFSLKAVTSLIFLGIPYHMPKLPAAKLKSERWPTPTSLLRAGVAKSMDMTTAGFKKTLKLFIKEQTPAQWDIEGMVRDVTAIMQNRKVKRLRLVLTPSIIHNLDGFTRDPVLKDYLEQIRKTAHSVVIDIKSAKDSAIVRGVLAMPIEAGSRIVASKFSVPKSLAELIIKCLNSQKFMDYVDACDQELRRLGPQQRFVVVQRQPTAAARPPRDTSHSSFQLRRRDRASEIRPARSRRHISLSSSVRKPQTTRAAMQTTDRAPAEIRQPHPVRAPAAQPAAVTAAPHIVAREQQQSSHLSGRLLTDFVIVDDYIGADGNAHPPEQPAVRR